jgi:tetratricopeptide (TPR) repeat protein
MRAIISAALPLITGGCATSPQVTPADLFQARTWCERQNEQLITPDLQIAGCTTLIQSGRETQRDLFATFIRRGQGYRDKDDNAHAIQDFDQAIRLKPDEWIVYNNRGYSYEITGDYDRAVQDYDQAIRLKPDDAGAFQMRCRTRADMNEKLEAALSDCNEALRLIPNDKLAFYSRGFVYFRMGDYDDAIADLDKRLKRDPKAADSLYVRGLAKRRRHDIAGGDMDIAAAKAIDPSVSDRFAGYGVKP